jgi:hypothetical protein
LIPLAQLLSGIPSGLRDPLIEEFRGLSAALLEEKWKAAGIDAGRFCEVAYTILEGALSGTFPQQPKKPTNFPEACKALESKSAVAVGDRSIRIMLPRALPPIYEIRNNRNIGHVGGDVVSNKMDATYVVSSCTFVLAELIRVFHNCSVSDAQASVDALVERKTPLIWDFGKGKRVLDRTMQVSDKVLVLLYPEPDWIDVASLFDWTKYSNASMFRSSVLSKLDNSLLIEFDRKADCCKLTPLGVKEVESRLLKGG